MTTRNDSICAYAALRQNLTSGFEQLCVFLRSSHAAVRCGCRGGTELWHKQTVFTTCLHQSAPRQQVENSTVLQQGLMHLSCLCILFSVCRHCIKSNKEIKQTVSGTHRSEMDPMDLSIKHSVCTLCHNDSETTIENQLNGAMERKRQLQIENAV